MQPGKSGRHGRVGRQGERVHDATRPPGPQAGGMAERVRDHDWSSSPVGPTAQWPQSLQTALSICLSSRFPLHVWWGPDLTVFYLSLIHI